MAAEGGGAEEFVSGGTLCGGKMPRKKFYRARAHCNPLSDSGSLEPPPNPSQYDWASHFSDGKGNAPVVFADVGCGFGGLTIRLAEIFPDKRVVGIEIRDKVHEYLNERIKALREERPGQFGNAAAVRSNVQKHLVHFFRAAQLEKLFFLFPDPHFKVSNHRRRIIQRSLLAEYAFVLKEGAIVYTLTDVADLGAWMADRLAACPLFQRLTPEEEAADPCVPLLMASEEAQKVTRNNGKTHLAVFRRIAAPAELRHPGQ